MATGFSGLSQDMKITGTDLFGMEYHETIHNEYTFKFGRPLVTYSRVTHTGWDIFGSSTTSITETTYH